MITRTVAVLTLAFTVAASAQERTAAVIAAAPIYIAPDTKRTPLRTLPVGMVLTIVEETGGWLRVEFQDPQFGQRIGYVQAKHVQRTAAARTAGRESSLPTSAERAATAAASSAPAAASRASIPAPPDLPPGIVAHMTPELIAEAIHAGETMRVSAVPVQAKRSWDTSSLPMATFTTPYLRVALRAADAKKIPAAACGGHRSS